MPAAGPAARGTLSGLLGAAGLGDIGRHFPDTDPKYKGADSLKLLEHVVALLEENSFLVGNVDATIIAQRPKMAPHIHKMRENIAKALKVPVSRVNVKATTEEGLGFTGAGEGISAQAICLLETVANYAYDDGMMQERQCGSCGGCKNVQEEA